MLKIRIFVSSIFQQNRLHFVKMTSKYYENIFSLVLFEGTINLLPLII